MRYWGATRHGNALVGNMSPLEDATAPRPRSWALKEEVEVVVERPVAPGDRDPPPPPSRGAMRNVEEEGRAPPSSPDPAACCRILTTSNGANAVTYTIDPMDPDTILATVDEDCGGGGGGGGGGTSSMFIASCQVSIFAGTTDFLGTSRKGIPSP